jgi:hypothetical protein
MTTVLLIISVGFLNVACFVIGAKVGQTIVKGEKVELPNLNPLKAYRENEARKEVEREQDKLNTIMRNIERYDGTGKGQEDVN